MILGWIERGGSAGANEPGRLFELPMLYFQHALTQDILRSVMNAAETSKDQNHRPKSSASRYERCEGTPSIKQRSCR